MLSGCRNIEDLRNLAARRLPRGVFEFLDGATEDHIALRRNRESFEDLCILPRALVDVSRRSTAAELFGNAVAMPLAIAPAGPAGVFWHDGDLAMARAAAHMNVPMGLTMYSTASLAEVAATGADVWPQLYLWNDRSISAAVVRSARELGLRTLLLTVDTPVLGRRERMHRSGFAPPMRLGYRAIGDMIRAPRWLAGVLGRYVLVGRWPRVASIPADCDPGDLRVAISPAAQWRDVEELRASWSGTLLIKGILRAEDAARAAAIGCDGIVVSNHGGRNLDAAPAPIDMLAEVIHEVKGRMRVLVDGGIRRGSDIFKALALGADAVMAGRAPLYGVAAAGEAGALHALELLRAELDTTMAYAGCCGIADISLGDISFGRRRTAR